MPGPAECAPARGSEASQPQAAAVQAFQASPSRLLASPASPSVPPVSSGASTRGSRHLSALPPDPMPRPSRTPASGGHLAAVLSPCRTVPIGAGWGSGNLRANGHPSGGPWRSCIARLARAISRRPTARSFHGKRVAPDLLVWAVGALAEGLGHPCRRPRVRGRPQHRAGMAGRGGRPSPRPFPSISCTTCGSRRCNWMNSLPCSVRSRTGEVSEAEAIKRLSRSPHWVWAAIDPVTKLLLTSTSATARWRWRNAWSIRSSRCWRQAVCRSSSPMASRSTRRRCSPITASGSSRRASQATRPCTEAALDAAAPAALCAGGQDRAAPASGAGDATAWCSAPWRRVKQVLAACGWQINTAFMERLNLTIRQHVAAVGRRVTTLCKGEDGLTPAAGLVSDRTITFCLPHASLRLPLPQPEPTNGSGLGQALAAPDASHGGGTDGSRLDAARGAALPRAAVAAASGGVSKPWWWEAARGGGLSRRRASTRPASRASPGLRGPLGGHDEPLV